MPNVILHVSPVNEKETKIFYFFYIDDSCRDSKLLDHINKLMTKVVHFLNSFEWVRKISCVF